MSSAGRKVGTKKRRKNASRPPAGTDQANQQESSHLASMVATSRTEVLTMKRRAHLSSHGSSNMFFPPTIFTDAMYRRGIMVPNNDDGSDPDSIRTELPYDYFGSDRHNVKARHLPYGFGGCKTEAGKTTVRLLPVLSEPEVELWAHKNAAFAAAGRRFPMEINRFLGSITLLLEEHLSESSISRGDSLDDVGLFSLSKHYSDEYRKRRIARSGIPREPSEKSSKFSRNVSSKEAMAEAMKEMGIDECSDSNHLPPNILTSLRARSEVIMRLWKAVKSGPPRRECWDNVHGGFLREALEESDGDESERDERHVPIHVLANWAGNEGSTEIVVTDVAHGRVASLYKGLRNVPTDAISIFGALLELSHPAMLYNVPLITPYAVAYVEKENSHPRATRTWKISIGVYANRLLFEVLTAQNLHIIMSALDNASFITTEPLHVPTMRDRDDPVFVSSPYPVVSVGDESFSEPVNEDNMPAEEEKEEDGDVAMMGSSREELTISAFSPEGFLKLLENTGNDISMWPKISKSLSPFLKKGIHLMLHQIHAICWMQEMETLGGFGLNSMIWEEREFFDGGKYYYSPALGQIRLGRPPDTRGGILADEMGLGKTLQMVSLIALTLADLKDEAKRKGAKNTHATLVVVPPALAAQWVKEIKKFVGDNLTVELLDARARQLVSGVEHGGNGVDVLVTTYQALDQPKTSKLFASFCWGRIVLDEMQEIRSSTTQIAKNCESLKCSRRWMLSGTPIFEGFDDLRGELNFLRLEPYAARLEDGFFQFSIMNHIHMKSLRGLETLRILGLLMLRRSKSMTIHRTGSSIMEQKRLTVEFIPIAQEPSERALYCWMEHVVDRELKEKEGEKDIPSRPLLLRLLREVCFSVVLLNGGLGVASQLKTINHLMVQVHRRAESRALQGSRLDCSSVKKIERTRTMSPDQALRHITQHQYVQKTSEDFVSDVRFGQGQGASNRAHAMDSVEVQVHKAQNEVSAQAKEMAAAISRRAKAHWHCAMEKITMGSISIRHIDYCVNPKFSVLWNWRFAFSFFYGVKNLSTKEQRCPQILIRGWRPSPAFLKRDFYASNPGCGWAHPLALRLDNIPSQISLEEIQEASYAATTRECQNEISNAAARVEKINSQLKVPSIFTEKICSKESKNVAEELRKAEKILSIEKDNLEYFKAHARVMKRPSFDRSKNYLQFSDEHDLRWFIRLASSRAGISVKTEKEVPRIQAALESAKANMCQAESEQKVYPCAANKKKEIDARKALRHASLGLRMIFTIASKTPTKEIVVSRAVDPFRTTSPSTMLAQLHSCIQTIEESGDVIARAVARIESGRKTIARLTPALQNGISQEVAKMSAFETLEALKECAFDKTRCPICLSPLGTASHSPCSSQESSVPIVAMTSCGHFFCVECIEDYVHRQMSIHAVSGGSRNQSVPCPNCRRPFSLSSDVIHIDHLQDDSDEKEEQKQAAKKIVRQVSRVLEESNGIIDGSLWRALYLSFDAPVGVSDRAHPVHTAIPRDILAHMRSVTGMKVDASRLDKPQGDFGLSSKMKQLVRDLPKNEHAVVFSTSKEGVLHIEAILLNKLVRCFSLFSGQNPQASEEAVTSWETDACKVGVPGPVLIVQAGAAASGLTLTNASKLFLMEPFSRQKEEQQAYARCHRYGQRNDVHVKIYYAPVSVESRLLEWRKKASESTPQSGGDTDIVFTNPYQDSEFSDSDADAEVEKEHSIEGTGEEGATTSTSNEDTRRTMFLLNLLDSDGSPLPVGGADQGVGVMEGIRSN